MNINEKYEKAIQGVNIAIATLKATQGFKDEYLIKNTIARLTELLEDVADENNEDQNQKFWEFKDLWFKAISAHFADHQKFIKEMAEYIRQGKVPQKEDFIKLKKIVGGK